MDTGTPIVHITSRDEWQQAGALDDVYRHESLDTEGFIHCSTPDQVVIPANERFAGRTDLVLLVIDPGRVSSPLVYEDCTDTGTEFPHVYGPIPLDAVVDVVAYPCRPDGTFDPPNLT